MARMSNLSFMFFFVIILVLVCQLSYAEDFSYSGDLGTGITKQHFWSTPERVKVTKYLGKDKEGSHWVQCETSSGRIFNRWTNQNMQELSPTDKEVRSINVSEKDVDIMFQRMNPNDPPGRGCPACFWSKKQKKWICAITHCRRCEGVDKDYRDRYPKEKVCSCKEGSLK